MSRNDEPSLRESSVPQLDQPLWCELCDQTATANDWIPALQQLVCPLCLERMLEDQP